MATGVAIQGWALGWTLGLVLGFPLLMLLLGELQLRLERRQQPLAQPLAILRQGSLPLAAAFVLLRQVLQWPAGAIFVRLAETFLWITLIYAALTLLNVLLFERGGSAGWQAKIPQILRDLGRFVLVCIGSAFVLSSVWGANLGGLLTALGVGSLVVGLALQDSLGNIFSGISLLSERPFSLGDWIRIGDKFGKVVEINWRSVHLVTRFTDLTVVPNSVLAKETFSNLSRPRRLHNERLLLSFSYDDPPNKVIKVIRDLLANINDVLERPRPDVSVYEYGDSAISYSIRFYSEGIEEAFDAVDDFKLRIWYAAKRHGLTMPYPIQQVMAHRPPGPTGEQRRRLQLQGVQRVACFATLPAAELESILAICEQQRYASQELVLRQGERLPGLFVIMEGRASLNVIDAEGRMFTIGVLAAGEYFGENASLLTEQCIDTMVLATEDLSVLLIDADTLHHLLEVQPRVAQDIGEVIEVRRRAIRALAL